MKDAKILLAARLAELNCDRVPSWLPARLLPLIEAEAADVAAKAEQQLNRRVARVVTIKSIAAAFLAGPQASQNNGEGSKGEGEATLLLPTVKTGTTARCA